MPHHRISRHRLQQHGEQPPDRLNPHTKPGAANHVPSAPGRCGTTAIRRYPIPPTLAVNAEPITTVCPPAAAATLPTGSSKCVAPQPALRARRGRTRTTPPNPAPTAPGLPPTGQHPRHPGQTIRSSTSRCSTAAASTPTVTTDASARHRTALRGIRQETTGGPLPTTTCSPCRRRTMTTIQWFRSAHSHHQRRLPTPTCSS